MAIYDNVFEMVGNTPLYHMPVKGTDCKVYLKLEMFNPGHSVKDRAARNMLLEAERQGLLKPGDTIIESSSGNTGIALAMLSAERGYSFICVVDNHSPKEMIEVLKAYGARVERAGQHLPPDVHAPQERQALIERLRKTIPNTFYVNQGDNLNNREAHYKTTAEEIVAELGLVDYLVASIGTGGSISGTGRRLKEYNSDTVVIAVEPAGSIIFGKPFSPFYQSGAGSGCLIFKNIDFSLIDEHYGATDRQAFNTCRYFARRKGLLVGGSAGGVIYKTIEYVTSKLCKGVVVALIPDGGERYLSTIYNDEWMVEQDLGDDDVWQFLDKHI